MGLPYNKTGLFTVKIKSDYQLSDFILFNDIAKFLSENNMSDIEKRASEISFTSNNSLFRIAYRITFSTDNKHKNILKYDIRLDTLLKITIAVALTGAFFARLSIEKFLIFELFLILIFFLLNLILIEFNIKKLLTSFVTVAPYFISDMNDDENFFPINDTSSCPACGSKLLENSNVCPSCRLNIPTSHGFKTYKPTSEKPETTDKQDFKYTYIDKKK